MARSILVQFRFSFFLVRLVSIPRVDPYSRIDTTGSLKKLRFILSLILSHRRISSCIF